jgi:hypothetical protein
MILAMNLDAIMRRLALPQAWTRRRMKAIRFHLVHVAGRVVRHGRRLWLRVSEHSLSLLADAREAIARLCPLPSG